MAIKRKQTGAGLIPFPRIGRSSNEKLWRRYDSDNERSHKREGLIPFPRVGRSGEEKNEPQVEEIQVDLYQFDPAIFHNQQHSSSSKNIGLQATSKKRMKKLEGLYPFPRVGKSVKQNDENILDNIAAVWFSPKIRGHELQAFELENERPISNTPEYSQSMRWNDETNHHQKQTSENPQTDMEETI